MKKTKYIFSTIAIAAGCLIYAFAGNNNILTKEKPVREAIGEITSHPAPAVQQRLTAAEDGAPYGLHVREIYNKDVTLTWNNPEAMNGYFEDFESHPDFEINSAGNIGWSYLDMDNGYTYTWAAASFTNQGQKMAAIIMNPHSTTPSVGDWPHFQPYSGKKMLAFFAVDGGNNDYIISPELNFDENFQISFRAKAYTNQYGLERVRVGYSTTGTQASNFTFVNEGDYDEVSEGDWQLFKYSIPKEAKYVTINCISEDAFMLLVDDIFIGTNRVRPRAAEKVYLDGFNLYRDGVKVNDELITEIFHTDTVTAYETYTYTVSAVYSDGSEKMSDELEVEVPDIRLLPFEDNFNTNTLNPDKWSTPEDEQGNFSRWSSGYHPYGLVDYSAQYVYSSLKNYSQSLITTELRTLDNQNTYLRFNLRHVNYNNEVGDSLAIEISCDNQQTWTRVGAFGNDEQTFEWRPEQFELGQYLTNELFNIRFRAFGADAYYIDYWYIDDVKVWCPQWTSATLTVMSQGAALANTPVTLTADHGAIVNATTDNNGVIELPKIEKGNYTINVDIAGYNPLSQEWSINEDTHCTATAQVTKPIIEVSEGEIKADLACEEKITRTLTLTNTGDGPVKWNFDPIYTAGSGDDSNIWDIQTSFDASGDLQTSIAFDGENFYTTSTFFLGTFYKYDRQGNFIEEFSIPGMYYMLYDLAFDGTYFYGSDLSNHFFCLDFRNKRLISEVVVKSEPNLKIAHCSYDPRNDQFWIGSFTSIGRIDREGNVTVALRPISTEVDMGVFGSMFDNVTPGGPYLWFSNNSGHGTNVVDGIQLDQFNLNTLSLTGQTHLADDVPGYKIGTITNANYICGIEGTTLYEEGTLSMIGIIKQSPSRIFVYELSRAQEWATMEPVAGSLNSGEEQVVTIDIDARNAKVGDTFTLPLSIRTTPQIEVEQVTIGFTASKASANPRPIELTATAEGNSTVILNWNDNAATPNGYNVYRNGEKINSTLITEKTYTDTKLVAGNYIYAVTAIYGDVESVMSDSSEIYLAIGAPYYAPVDITQTTEQNRYVTLSWQSPNAHANEERTLRWDDGTNGASMGLTEGGYFWAGAKWEHTELVEYRNMILDTVEVFIQERFLALNLYIYQDGKRVTNQKITADEIRYGEYNKIGLKNPITIEQGSDFIVSFMVSHDAGTRPIGVDASPAINGKGNVISMDGKEWYPLTHMGMNGNFNIALYLNPAVTPDEEPVGYNAYRDGERINAELISDTTYTDDIAAPGIYEYSVSSVYADGGESAQCESITAEILQLYTPVPPRNVVAETEFNRTIHVRWDFPIEQESSFPIDLEHVQATAEEGYPEYVNSFKGNIPGEMGIASDGEYIYTSIHNTNGTINKYDLAGNHIESILIDTYMSGIRNLAYDGTDFYAVDYNNCIYRIDIENKCISDTINISEFGRHLAYIPTLDEGRGGFEVGDWESSIYVTKQGAKLGDGPVLKGASGSAFHNGKLYTFEQGYEKPYTICRYDQATGTLESTIDISSYLEITPETGAKAGGMSVINTKEGLTLLAVGLQEQSNCRFIFFDLGSITGLAGYNVYRNGEKRNDEPIPFRYFSEDESVVGTYEYEIETVYINSSISERSHIAYVDIFDAENCDAPCDIKAVQSSYGYNVNISFVDPTTMEAALYQSFENVAVDTAFADESWENIDNAWYVTDTTAFQGNNALVAERKKNAWLIIPMNKNEQEMVLTLAARNHDDHLGHGSIRVLTSANGNNLNDFIPLATITTTEAWKEHRFTIEPGTDYIAIHHDAATTTQYIDAITLDTHVIGQAYGYDIMRDGEQINDELITGNTYTDRNLLPGEYSYQVRAYYESSCISEYSEPVTINVDYSNGCQKPGMLFVSTLEDGTNSLSWSAPALGDAIDLRWHSGGVHDAAGMPSGGAYFAGVQWNSEDLQEYEKLSVTEVEVYINHIPDALFLLIYEGENLIYQQYVPNLIQYSFNTIELNTPHRINIDKSLRVVVYVEHNEISVPLGYDEGPAKVGRGDLYSSDGITWSTLNANEIDGNWNITLGLRAFADKGIERVAPKMPIEFSPMAPASQEKLRTAPVAQRATSERNVFGGYNVYCNSELLNDEPLQETYFFDSEMHTGNFYEYQVKAIYSGCGEVGSNVVRIKAPASGLNAINAEGVNIAVRDERVYITGLVAGDKVALCDTAGKVIYNGTSQGEAEFVINATILPQGVYIVHAAGETAKVVISE